MLFLIAGIYNLVNTFHIKIKTLDQYKLSTFMLNN